MRPDLVRSVHIGRVPWLPDQSTGRRPFLVHTWSSVVTCSIGTHPRSVWISVPSRIDRLPPDRRRSVSSRLLAPNSLASDPFGQRTTVPPGTVTILADGSWAMIPDGPVTHDVAASPSVGAMIPIQCGDGPGRHGGPLTCWATYSAQVSVLPAPRPASSNQPYQSPDGGTWWGRGDQRGDFSSATRAAMMAAALRATSRVSLLMAPWCRTISHRPAGSSTTPLPSSSRQERRVRGSHSANTGTAYRSSTTPLLITPQQGRTWIAGG